MTARDRIAKIAAEAIELGCPPIDTPSFRGDLRFARAHSHQIWQAIGELRAESEENEDSEDADAAECQCPCGPCQEGLCADCDADPCGDPDHCDHGGERDEDDDGDEDEDEDEEDDNDREERRY